MSAVLDALVLFATDDELFIGRGCVQSVGGNMESVAVRSQFRPGPPPTPATDTPRTSWPTPYRLAATKIVAVECERFFPRLRITYRGPDVDETYALGTEHWPGLEPSSAIIDEYETLERLLEWVRARGVSIVGGGWLAAPEVRYERSPMPERRRGRDAVVGYRDSARVDPTLWTESLGTHERLLRWMAVRLGRSWPIPEEVAVDRDTVFVRPRGAGPEEALAIPLSTLRARRDHGVDAVYVFGRYAQLPMLGRREGCPVRARLDEALAQRGA